MIESERRAPRTRAGSAPARGTGDAEWQGYTARTGEATPLELTLLELTLLELTPFELTLLEPMLLKVMLLALTLLEVTRLDARFSAAELTLLDA
ncbi:MAG TPA: hypothetical protein V6C76_02815 [Drouetiella sp.]